MRNLPVKFLRQTGYLVHEGLKGISMVKKAKVAHTTYCFCGVIGSVSHLAGVTLFGIGLV